MRRFDDFAGKDGRFWKEVRFVSQALGYTTRGTGSSPSEILSYSPDEIANAFRSRGYNIDRERVNELAKYSEMRKSAIESAKELLMDAKQAKEAYESVSKRIGWEAVYFDPPMNKQKGSKRDIAFLTAIVDLLTFEILQKYSLSFDHDPHSLLEFTNVTGDLVGVSSRRFDGAAPSTRNPYVVWEIKEYYYTTTFGSRIADGVYESRLDGFELNEFDAEGAQNAEHVLFVDSYSVWWEQGKSYFCRLIDMLNEGSVDEIIFGKEALSRWPILLDELTRKHLSV